MVLLSGIHKINELSLKCCLEKPVDSHLFDSFLLRRRHSIHTAVALSQSQHAYSLGVYVSVPMLECQRLVTLLECTCHDGHNHSLIHLSGQIL